MTKEEFNGLSKAEKREAKKECFSNLKEILKDSEEGTEILKILKPSLFGIMGVAGRGGGEPKWKKFADMFEKKGSQVNELTMFQELKSGRHECRIFIKNCIKKAEPENRKWIDFDPEAGVYTLVKIGADQPSDWTGYVPMEKLAEDEVSLL